MAARWVELGRIGAPFGVKGWMHVDFLHRPARGPARISTMDIAGWLGRPRNA